MTSRAGITRLAIAAAVLSSGITTASVSGQTPDLSGTWTLDVKRSRITTALLRGGGDGGPADTLHITHAANGTLVVGNEVNAGQAWSYRSGGESTIPVGERDRMTVTSRWEGSRFVSEGSRKSESREAVRAVKEVRSLSPDGQTLTVEETIGTSGGDNTNTLIYQKVS